MSTQALGTASAAAPLPQVACAAWNSAATITLRGTTESQGFSGVYSMTLDARAGRFVAARDYGAYSRAEGFDGKLDWTRDWSGAAHFLDSETAQAISITQSWLRRRAWCQAAADAAESVALPDETDAGVAEAVWRVTPRGGIAVILRFERASGLLLQAEIQHQFNRMIQHYADWRDSGNGLLIPFTEQDQSPEDESVETIRLTSVKIGGETGRAGNFAKPKQPRDYAILENAASTTVAYEDDRHSRIYVPVLIDAKGPFVFELDTGGHLILTPETAALLHFQPHGNLSETGAGPDVVHGGLVQVHELRIGAAVIRNQVAQVFALSKVGNDRGILPPRAGIIGPELLERFVVQLDRTAKKLTLTPLAAFKSMPGGISLPIRFTEDAPETRGTFAGVTGDFMLDSGDAGPAIVYGFWARDHGLAERLSQGIQWSGNGVGGAFPETLSRGDFTLGPLSLAHEIVSYVGTGTRGDAATRMLAGVIGESSLYRFAMTYDYGRGLVWIDPQSKVSPHGYNRSGLDLKKDTPQSFIATLVVPNSPAQDAGLKPGDRILAVNSQPAAEMSRTDALEIFSGPVGSDVALLIAPKDGGESQPRHMQLKELLP